MLDEGKASWHLKGLCCLARGGRRKRGRRGACLASRRKKARKSIIEEEATFLRLAERSKKGRDLKNFLCRRLRRLWCALQQNSPTNFVYEGPTIAGGGTRPLSRSEKNKTLSSLLSDSASFPPFLPRWERGGKQRRRSTRTLPPPFGLFFCGPRIWNDGGEFYFTSFPTSSAQMIERRKGCVHCTT